MAINKTFGKDEEGNTVLLHSEEVPDPVELPNWLGLEQALRYSPLYGKALTLAKTSLPVAVGMNLFMMTLSNGKRGDASENALAFAFSQLGIEWSEEELDGINTLLSNNNFTITIQ